MANLNVSSYITSAGLQAVTSAGGVGAYFAVKYFVPFYDPSFDASLSLGNSSFTSATKVSALALYNATSVPGEVIFASSAANYTLSDPKFFYQRAGMNTIATGASGVLTSKQEYLARVNMLSNKALTQVVSAATVVPTTTIGSYTLTNAYNVSGSNLATYNPLASKPYPTSAFFRVQSYSPKATGTSAVGQYKCRIPAGDGSFKFNGLALFVNKVTGDGNDVLGQSRALFGFVVFDKPQIKSNAVGGVNSFEVDVDLGFDWSSLNTNGSNPIYYESSYWTKVPTASNTSAYALNYDGDVVISCSAAPGSWAPQGKLTIVDSEKTQLRLSYDNGTYDRYTDITTKRRNAVTGVVGYFSNSTDRGVLSIAPACDSDSLLELGQNCVALSKCSIAMGIGAYTSNSFSGNAYTSEDGYNLAFGYGAISRGEFNTTIGQGNSSMGKYNFSFGLINYAGSINQSDFHNAANTGYNFAFGLNTSAITSESLNIVISDYFSSNTYQTGHNFTFGLNTISNGGHAFSFGRSVKSNGLFSTTFGGESNTSGSYSTTFGLNNTNNSHFTFIHGKNNSSKDTNYFGNIFGAYNNIESIVSNVKYQGFNNVFGSYNKVSNGSNSFIVGHDNELNKQHNSLVFGQNNYVVDTIVDDTLVGYNLVFGRNNKSTKTHNLVFGLDNINDGRFNLVFGSTTNNSTPNKIGEASDYSMAFGVDNNIDDGNHNLAFGIRNTIRGKYNWVGGYENNVAGNNSLVYGIQNKMITSIGSDGDSGDNSFAFGFNNTIRDSWSHVYGNNSEVNATNTLSFGNNNIVNHEYSIAIGKNAKTTQSKQVMIGGEDINNITLKATTITLDGAFNKTPSYAYDFSFIRDRSNHTRPHFSYSITEYLDGIVTSVKTWIYDGSSTSNDIWNPDGTTGNIIENGVNKVSKIYYKIDTKTLISGNFDNNPNYVLVIDFVSNAGLIDNIMDEDDIVRLYDINTSTLSYNIFYENTIDDYQNNNNKQNYVSLNTKTKTPILVGCDIRYVWGRKIRTSVDFTLNDVYIVGRAQEQNSGFPAIDIVCIAAGNSVKSVK